MINILKEYKGKVVGLYLRGNKNPYAGIVDKINEKDFVLRMHCRKRYMFINIHDISAIVEDNIDPNYSFGTFEDHVIPSAFS